MSGTARRSIYHVGIGVRDFEESLEFYRLALRSLGVTLVEENETDNRSATFGVDGQDDFLIFEGRPQARAHIAFRSPSREAVDQFHVDALAAGGRDNGAPGVRAERAADYYAAYVLDPNGNNIEAVWRESAETAID
jgi:catechol 2,3-dioxygenase-like lactoylglutathione lyase family enzyme